MAIDMASGGATRSGDALAYADSFLDAPDIRERASIHALDEFDTLPFHHGDREVVVRLLNSTLAATIASTLRYRRHHFMVRGTAADPIRTQLRQLAAEDQVHADLVAERIGELGGAPDLYPMQLHDARHSGYVEGDGIAQLLHEDLIAAYSAIASYGEVARYLGDSDPTTRQMLDGIVAVKGEHASQLAAMLETLFGTGRT
ncbi:MAG: ferritin-like domain-containing protein [Pseudomonadota bacterium]